MRWPTGTIDGFCVGEPWNTRASLPGHGHIATVKAAIWRSSPEKVLGAGARWADDNPEALAALLRAICRAAQWCGDPGNHGELAAILAGPAYLGRPAEWLMPALSGRLACVDGARQPLRSTTSSFRLRKAATFPWKSHALWFYSQMVRWGQVQHTPDNAAIARETYRPDLYRARCKPLGVALPVGECQGRGRAASGNAGRLGRR